MAYTDNLGMPGQKKCGEGVGANALQSQLELQEVTTTLTTGFRRESMRGILLGQVSWLVTLLPSFSSGLRTMDICVAAINCYLQLRVSP